MSFPALVIAGRGLQLTLFWLALTRTRAEAVDHNATLCHNTSFVGRSGYILSESYPDQVNNEAHRCQCSVSGKQSELTIVFDEGSIQDTCNERLVISDADWVIRYDSCREVSKLINTTTLSTVTIKDEPPALITFEKYLNIMKKEHGNFKLRLHSTSEMTVNCTDNRNAEIPLPKVLQSQKLPWIIIVYVLAVLFLVVVVIALTVFLCRKVSLKLTKQKNEHPVSPLHHLESASRRHRERPENDYALTPAQTMNVRREYEEIPIGGFRSTQQTNLTDGAVTEHNAEISEGDATGGNDRKRPDTDASKGNGSDDLQVNNSDYGQMEAKVFDDSSAELVENITYKSVEAELQLTTE